MQFRKQIQADMSFDGNLHVNFGKEADVTKLDLCHVSSANSDTQMEITIRDEDYKEVKILMDMRLFSQMFALMINDLDYNGYGERDIQSLSEASELLLSMKKERGTT